MSEAFVMQVLGFVAATVLCLTGIRVLGRVLLRWMELRRQPPAAVPDAATMMAALEELRDRLAQIERTVDASALELERIGEADRYIAKLLAERAPAALPVPRAERVITPH